ncbi:MAG TPA: GntR family transcriptional regulator [Solirubrobacter sp.]
MALERVSTVDALVAELRRQVLSGELGPGAQLKEVELSERYGVGRYSLRTAMRVLTDEGLLRHEAHRGVFVPHLTRADVEDLFILRTALEVEAATLAARRGLDLTEAERAVQQLEAITGEEPWDEVTEKDLAFHHAYVDAVGSRRLSRSFEAMTSELRLVMAQTRTEYTDPRQVGREHREILDGLRSGDPSRAEAAVRAHLEEGVQTLLSQLP